jgi:hypothetical protein
VAEARGIRVAARSRRPVGLVSARHRGLGVVALGLVVTLVSAGPARAGAGAPDPAVGATVRPSAVGPKAAADAGKPLPPAAGAPVVATDAVKPSTNSKLEVELKPKAKGKGKGRSPAELAKRVSVVRKAVDKSNAAVTAEGGSSPPLDVAAMRAEVHRESRPPELDATELPETKVEKMLAEVAKAREALHEDTLKLEALAAAAALKPAAPPVNPDDEGGESDGRPRTEGEGASGAAATAGGKPPAKNPQDILAKALRGIKPEQAAPIVTRLDPQLAASVLQRMPPADAGKILAAMKADNAAVLATLIAARKPRPDGRGEVRSGGVANPVPTPVTRSEAPSAAETRSEHKRAPVVAAADPAGKAGSTAGVAAPVGAEAASTAAPAGAEAQK